MLPDASKLHLRVLNIIFSWEDPRLPILAILADEELLLAYPIPKLSTVGRELGMSHNILNPHGFVTS